MVISILVPLYNEQEFVATLLERALVAPLPPGFTREIIVVDDASTDDSAAAVLDVALRFPDVIRLIRFPLNRGKGAAVRRAIEEARGEFCIVQDADLEYNPNDYLQLLQPLVDGVADAVYGSRFAAGARRRVLYYAHSLANHMLTGLSNLVSGLNLTDMETGYKAFRTSLVKSIPLRSNRFGFEPEITIKLAKRHARVYEVPISYEGRTYEEGKKIGLADAVAALFTMMRFGLTSDLYTDSAAEILDAFSVAPRFNQWMADTIRPFLGRRVLEIGAGMGNLTRPLSLGRDRYVASDVDSRHLARLKATLKHRVNIEVHSGDAERPQDFEQFHESMESVVCLNVMEHVDDDLVCARNMYSALLSGGRAVVLVPHGPPAFGTLDAVLGHRRRYTRKSLNGVLERAGFVVEKIIAFNRISWPAWYIQGKLLRRLRISRLSLRLFDASVFLWRRLDRLIPFPPISLIAIAKKPASVRSESNAVAARLAPTATPSAADNSAGAFDSLPRRGRAPK
ncbi:MAG TPA: glycosyltransferase [Bryobacteraceae bacterium]|nr:glycosyltransferase [Bryobacteraceae bacterium]